MNSKKNIKNTRVKRIILEIALQVLFFVSIGFAIYFGVLGYPVTSAYKLVYVAVVVVASYGARSYIKSAGLFMLVHVIFIIGGAVVGGTEEEAFIMALNVFIVVLVSFVYRKMRSENKGEGFNIAMALVFLVEYFSGTGSGNVAVMEVAVWSAVLFVVLYIVYLNYTRLENLFFLNSGTSNFPAARIVATNTTIARLAAMIACLGMVVFYSGPLGNIFITIKNLFLKLLGWLLSLLFADMEHTVKPVETVATEEFESTSESFFRPEEVNMPLKDFLNALFIIIAVVIIIVAIYFIIRAIRNALRYAGNVDSIEADIIEAVNDRSEDISESLKKKEQEISDADLNLRARKLYKKQVKSVKKEKGVPGAAALAKDITKMFEEGNAADEITRVYEKARYSNETVTKEEVEVIKKST